jgi:hypothetical protein
MEARRYVHFVVASAEWTGADLLEHLGPADEPVESVGDTVGPPGALRVRTESTWIAVSGLPESAEVEEQLAALFRRVDAALDRLRGHGRAPIRGVLRIVQYLPYDESQGHGFVLGREWVSLLAEIDGLIDIDQYVITDGQGSD